MRVTLLLFVGGCALAAPVAILAGLGKLSSRRMIRGLAVSYIEFFRGTSALVQLYWVYFALPLIGIELGAFLSGILVLGLNSGAYGAEVVRGAIQAVPKGQIEAAKALNLSSGLILRRIVFPQAAIMMIPSATNLLIELLKNTSLASLITLSEMVFEGQVLRATTLRTAEIYGLLLVLYSLIARLITMGMRSLETALGKGLLAATVK